MTTHQAILNKRPPGGFTLLEVSVAISVALGLSVVLISLIQQHVTFMQMFQRQTFLVREAPNVGNLVGRMLNSVDHFFVYPDRETALAGGQPILGTGQAVGLFFKSPAEAVVRRVLAVEAVQGGRSALRCYTPQSGGGVTSWTVSNQLMNAEFRAEDGILGLRLRGPNGEEVTYWGGAR